MNLVNKYCKKSSILKGNLDFPTGTGFWNLDSDPTLFHKPDPKPWFYTVTLVSSWTNEQKVYPMYCSENVRAWRKIYGCKMFVMGKIRYEDFLKCCTIILICTIFFNKINGFLFESDMHCSRKNKHLLKISLILWPKFWLIWYPIHWYYHSCGVGRGITPWHPRPLSATIVAHPIV